MTVILVPIALVISALTFAAGIALGWKLRDKREPERAPVVVPAPAAPEVKSLSGKVADDEPDAEQLSLIMSQLTGLADATAEGVERHNTRVQQISSDLAALTASGDNVQQGTLDAAAELLRANQQLQAELATVKTQLNEHAKKVESSAAEARTDALSGVANRRAFDEELARRYAAWQRHGTPFSLLMIDVDHFKKFNDTHGHQAGDAVIRGVGKALSATVRDMDFLARYGGEEFAVIASESRLADAKPAAERLRAAIEAAKFEHGGVELRVTASLGVAEAMSGDDTAALIKHSDEALYAAKKNGRNRAYYYDGKTSLPVEPVSDAPAEKPVQAVPKEMLKDLGARGSDRRTSPRRPFSKYQMIAPFTDGQIPTADMFRKVLCNDISSGGISFVLPSPPEYDAIVVALGDGANVTFVSAKVARCHKMPDSDPPAYLVGCKFTGRVKFDANAAAAQAAKA